MSAEKDTNNLKMLEDEDFAECLIECDRLLVVKGNDYTMGRPPR